MEFAPLVNGLSSPHEVLHETMCGIVVFVNASGIPKVEHCKTHTCAISVDVGAFSAAKDT